MHPNSTNLGNKNRKRKRDLMFLKLPIFKIAYSVKQMKTHAKLVFSCHQNMHNVKYLIIESGHVRNNKYISA